MTNEEAIKELNTIFISAYDDFVIKHKAIEMAIEALEKQILVKPTYELQSKFFGTEKRICPVCGDVVVIFPTAKKSERFCRYCGVRLS